MNPARMLSVLILFFITHFISISAGGGGNSSSSAANLFHQQQQHMVVAGPTEYRVAGADLTAAVGGNGGSGGIRRRDLGPFQLCLACKCCGVNSDPSNCVTMPCCFGIDCQLPNKPFGVCAFVPKTCNCTTCTTT